MDVDSIPFGADFAKVISQAVSSCDVFLAIIGPRWLDARDASGRRRLDDSNDLVRREIATALRCNVDVVPVLLDDASVPVTANLPADLMALSHRNSLRVRHDAFHRDMSKLVKLISDRKPVASNVPSGLGDEAAQRPKRNGAKPRSVKSMDDSRIRKIARRTATISAVVVYYIVMFTVEELLQVRSESVVVGAIIASVVGATVIWAMTYKTLRRASQRSETDR